MGLSRTVSEINGVVENRKLSPPVPVLNATAEGVSLGIGYWWSESKKLE